MNIPYLLDYQWMETVKEKFEYKKKLAHLRKEQLFDVFLQPLTKEEVFSLQFLYAYMPLNDLADYDGELFLSHVRKTLEIRNQVPWGKKVPDHLFFHFVLPYRVNNENIEDSRGVLFDQLFDRVQGLSLSEAILETNYWCHEKATYTGNDPRTVSPLTLMRTTLGRCGEQSTLAVAALRSLCIPARQCYTPRWAHCDSNHAWVEAWTEGEWHFLGACEPEARLDQGWFRAPAKRAMLVNTRVPANYSGPEEITLQHPWYTEINLLDNYAANTTIQVKVQNQDRTPSVAKVYFQLYNFAEFSTIVTKRTDASGEVSLTTGLGDIYIHAVGSKGWNSIKIHTVDADVFTIVLARKEPEDGVMEFEMIPPPSVPDSEKEIITEQEQQRNDERVQEGARIRAAYEVTFVNEEQAIQLASELSLPADRMWMVLRKARGNSHEITAFLQEQTPLHGELPLTLLESLNDKDLTDTFRLALTDHLESSLPFLEHTDPNIFTTYILCPRIHYEMIIPYKQRFQQTFSQEDHEMYRNHPQALYNRLAGEFEIIEDMNYYNGSATPIGSYELQKGDQLCFHIMLIAAARSLGIPARLEPNNQRPQYWNKGSWSDFQQLVPSKAVDNLSALEPVAGFARFIKEASSDEQEAAYSQNFTIARWEGGIYKTLTLPFGKKDVFELPIEVLSGRYRLTTGTRLTDGTTKVRFAFFEIRPDETTEVPLVFRNKDVNIPILGVPAAAAMEAALFNPKVRLGITAQSKGAIVAWIEPDREPSKHLLRELRELAKEFDAWGGPILLVAGEDKLTASFNLDQDTSLPHHSTFRKDRAYKGLETLLSTIEPKSIGEFPIVLVLDSEGRIRYTSSGYKLGTGREVLDVVTRM